MAVRQQLMTAEMLLRLPDDHQRYELIAGELRTMPLNGVEHGVVAATVTAILGQFTQIHKLGRVYASGTGFLLATNPDTVLAPDGAFVSRERTEAVGRVTGYWPGAPDLAIEVISPNDLYTEVDEKVAMWLANGTRMAIVVNPRRRTVAVHRSATEGRHLTADDVLDGEDVVPGWSAPVKELFDAFA
jgi:Uma2 family endonuclease